MKLRLRRILCSHKPTSKNSADPPTLNKSNFITLAQDAVFSTYELLDNIFIHSTLADLWSIELVSKTWRKVALNSLRVRKSRVLSPWQNKEVEQPYQFYVSLKGYPQPEVVLHYLLDSYSVL